MKSFKLSVLLALVVGSSVSLAASNPEHKSHDSHKHDKNCGHAAINHGDHVDYIHDGHTHNQANAGKVFEHKLRVVSSKKHTVAPKEGVHKHGADCGHEAIKHGDHNDYVVDGKVHHVHADHCDLSEVAI